MTDTQERELFQMLNSDETRWFARRRLNALHAAGLLAGSYWNPDLHPRGPDGKFIEQWGFVRWLVDGLWHRGRVTNLLPGGKVIVQPDSDPNPLELDHDEVYSLPTPKGHIKNGPDPSGELVPAAWTKVGEQAGSNPGAFYSTAETTEIKAIDKQGVEDALYWAQTNGWSEAQPTKNLKQEQPQNFVALYTAGNGEKRLAFRTGGEPVPADVWNELRMTSSEGLIWTTDSGVEAIEAKLALESGKDLPEGTKFYVKRTKSVHHAANEMLANEFYKLAGVPVPDLYFGDHQTVASKILTSTDPDSEIVPLSAVKNDPEVLRQIRENMVIDAWLANWDVAGMTMDNIMVVDGVPYRIDTGGSLAYRAQGGTKDEFFGSVVGEISTFLDSGKNPSSSHVFKGFTYGEGKAATARVAAISPAQIREMARATGVSSSIADTLVARRQYLLDLYEVEDPYFVYVPPKLWDVSRKIVPDEMFWNPIANQWQPGIVKESPSVIHDKLTMGIKALHDLGDPELQPVVGDLVTGVSSDNPEIVGVFRVVHETPEYGKPVLMSALDPTNETRYVMEKDQVRVLPSVDGEVPNSITSLYTQYTVAIENEQTKIQSLDDVFGLATDVNQYAPKPALTPRAYAEKAQGDDLWEVQTNDFVFHEYMEDPTASTRRIVYRVKGVTDNSVSLINVIDGKERIVDKATWEGNTEMSEWFVPDPYTQDLTLALLRRDRLIDQSDILKIEKVETQDVIPGVSTDANTPFNTTPVTEADLAALGITETYTTEFGVNKNIVTGQEYELGDMWGAFLESIPYDTLEEVPDGFLEDTLFHQFLGQSVIISTEDTKKKIGYYDGGSQRGVWFVYDLHVQKDVSYDKAFIRGKMYLRSPLGEESVIEINNTKMAGNGFGGQIIQTVESIDASVPQLAPTFKDNGDIVWNGVVIGAHTKSYYGFQAKIFPEYAINGTAHTIQTDKKYNLKTEVGKHGIPQLTPEVALKSAKSKKAKELLLGAIPLKARRDFKTGTWVQAPDGWVGQVEEVPGIDLFNRFPSHVKLLGKDGKVRIVHANLLLEMPEEPEVTTAVLPDPITPAAVDKIVGHAPFFPLKYGDGNDPQVGQKVKAGKGEKQITGYVTWVTPPGGKQASITPYADVVDADGKKWKKSLSTIQLVEEVDGSGPAIPPATGLPTDTKAAVEVIMDFTPQQVSDMSIKYTTADGKLLAQPQWEKEVWLQGAAPGQRKLTKDGYAPKVGMRLRTDETPGDPLVVVEFDDPYKKPNYVKVLNLHTGTVSSRAISRLWVDHQAELEGVEYVKGITMPLTKPEVGKTIERLPNGTVIYRAIGNQNVKIGGVWRQQDQYFFIAENGKIQLLSSEKKGAQPITHNTEVYLTNLVQTGKLEKVAVIDETSPNFAAFTDHFDAGGFAESSASTPTAFVVYNPGEVSHEEALSGYFVELTGVAVEGTTPAVGIPKEHLVNVLAKPADAIDVTAETYAPEPPPITGKVGAIDKTPKKLPVHSVVSAGSTALGNKDSTAAGSGIEFAFGDAEYIEDMQVRTLIARDTATGQEYVEFHFRMVEDKAEATSDKLLSAGKDITYGKWVQKEMRQASQLQVGDTISVRVSSTSEAVKPGNGPTPNARVITEPVLLGVDGKGIPVYRVGIASSDGHTGAMDIQERSMPSLAVFEWDAEAVASQSNNVKVSLTSKATQAGWSEVGTMGYDFDESVGNISIATTGAKLYKPTSVRAGVRADSKGRRIHRDFPDGSHVRFNAVPSSVSGSASATGSSYGDIRRWNEAGMVTIRVPIALADDSKAMQAAVSRAMEAVGIPSEKQAPASDGHIALFGLGKLYKTHAPGFVHRQSPIQNADLNDSSVKAVFERMDKELSPYLGRPIQLEDIEFHVSEDGRLTALLSRDVARAITQRQGNVYYRHSLYDSSPKAVAEILAGPNRGLMGGADRYASGILVSAKSTESDMSKGAGNRVYLTARQMESLGDSAFIFSPDAINQSLDIYANSNDGWGHRADTNRFLVTGGNGENMLKGLVDPTQVAFYVSHDSSHRDKVLELLKAKGVTHIGSRPIEEVIVLKVPFPMDSDEFRNLGVSSDPAASVPAIKPIPTTPAGDVAPVPGAEAATDAAAGGGGEGGGAI